MGFIILLWVNGGLGVALGERMYVKRLNKKLNQVEIAPRPGVLNARCKVKDIHWINNISINNILECEVRPRYRCTGSLAKILIENDSAEIIFNDPQFALALVKQLFFIMIMKF